MNEVTEAKNVFIVLRHRWFEYETQDSVIDLVSFNRELAMDHVNAQNQKHRPTATSREGSYFELFEEVVV